MIAWHTSSVCVPLVLVHAASSPPSISRSSERAYSLFSVVTPPAVALNTTPSPASLTAKASLLNVASSGLSTVSG